MKEKKCSKCGEIKLISEFNNDKTTKDGKYSSCIKCFYLKNLRFKRTEIGLIKTIYYMQVISSKDRKMHKPDYSIEEFIKWVLGQDNFKSLYFNWVKSDYYKYLRPSTDRIEDKKGYTFDNIRLVTWGFNEQDAKEKVKKGINTSTCIPVLQYDLNGNFIKEYYSQHQAARETGIHNTNIQAVCANRVKTAGGYIWKYRLTNTNHLK